MNQLSENKKILILMIFPVSCLVMSLFVSDVNSIFRGLYDIIVHPDILITDYIKVGGLGAALVNSAILTLLNILILWKYKIRISGVSVSAIFIIAGFSFFGKNIFNVWPIYLGGFLYAKYQKKSFKNVVIISMFGTALSPLVNEIAYGLNLPFSIGMTFAILAGILAGFILPPISAHVLKAHEGYNLYNVGFAAGFIGTIAMSFLKSYGFVYSPRIILSTEHDILLKIFLASFFIVLIVLGYYINGMSFKGYSNILWYSGRLVTDFTHLVGFGLSLINMGIMGLIGMTYVIISNGTINGPIIGGLLTIVGFSSFGKHPKNCLPIMAGVFIAGLLKIWDTNSTTVIIAALFGTSLAPIAGEYGTISGLLAGFLHLSVVMNVGVLHGGINLYNNGFSAGIVATLLVPVIDAIKKED
ncbi:DUF1576 domain-containing protein [Brassicibacter mesophilus]|uniref:DUF1576 domain-containing protein n=1 Tax=Brassicibacter mesophilus TaxID=745119 RepID=UPI003D1A9F0C